MKKILVLAAILVLCTAAWGAQYPDEEIPMYNGRFTPEMRRSMHDQALVKAGSEVELKKRANQISVGGWQAFFKGDVRSAVTLFNQSWILDPDAFSTYWGFALVYRYRDHDMENAEAMYAKAETLHPDLGKFYVEYGRFVLETDLAGVNRSIVLFRKGVDMNPNIRDGYIGLIRANAMKGDVKQMRYWFEKGKAAKAFETWELDKFEAEIVKMEKGS